MDMDRDMDRDRGTGDKCQNRDKCSRVGVRQFETDNPFFPP